MKKEIKARWVAALRSGVYAQTKEKLRSGDGYCCLGVLCDLHANETNTPWTPDGFSFMYKWANLVLPSDVRKWAGLTLNDPTVKVNGKQESLSNMNDTHQKSFDDIADAIEKGL